MKENIISLDSFGNKLLCLSCGAIIEATRVDICDGYFICPECGKDICEENNE